MDKRQKLKFNSPSNSFELKIDPNGSDQYIDSTIILPTGKVTGVEKQNLTEGGLKQEKTKTSLFEPQNPEFDEIVQSHVSNRSEKHKTTERDFDSVDFDVSSVITENFSVKSIKNQDKVDPTTTPVNPQHSSMFQRYKHVIAYSILSAIVIYLLCRPSEYKLLLDEIQILREQKGVVDKQENIACIYYGCTVGEHSELYKYGFLKMLSTDKDAFLESGKDFVCFATASGFFDIHFAQKIKPRKFGLYHPKNANPKSAIKDFLLELGAAKQEFTFTEMEYQEFVLESHEASTIRVNFQSNHGEPKYTSVYRIFIFI